MGVTWFFLHFQIKVRKTKFDQKLIVFSLSLFTTTIIQFFVWMQQAFYTLLLLEASQKEKINQFFYSRTQTPQQSVQKGPQLTEVCQIEQNSVKDHISTIADLSFL